MHTQLLTIALHLSDRNFLKSTRRSGASCSYPSFRTRIGSRKICEMANFVLGSTRAGRDPNSVAAPDPLPPTSNDDPKRNWPLGAFRSADARNLKRPLGRWASQPLTLLTSPVCRAELATWHICSADPQ